MIAAVYEHGGAGKELDVLLLLVNANEESSVEVNG
jgi:hypothetical protein